MNVAARLEQLNKETGTEILLSRSVFLEIDDAELRTHLDDLGEFAMKGRAERVRIYSA